MPCAAPTWPTAGWWSASATRVPVTWKCSVITLHLNKCARLAPVDILLQRVPSVCCLLVCIVCRGVSVLPCLSRSSIAGFAQREIRVGSFRSGRISLTFSAPSHLAATQAMGCTCPTRSSLPVAKALKLCNVVSVVRHRPSEMLTTFFKNSDFGDQYRGDEGLRRRVDSSMEAVL